MTIHYRAESDRFYTDTGKRVSRANAMRSSVARREYEEEGLAAILETLSKVSGIDIGDILESEFQSPIKTKRKKSLNLLLRESKPDRDFDYDVGEDTVKFDYDAGEDTLEDDPDYDNDWGEDSADYIDALFDDIEVDAEESDAYDGEIV